MKKVFTLIVLLCVVCMGAWADIQSSTVENPVPYLIRNLNCGYIANDLSRYHANSTDVNDEYGQFIFIETGKENQYKIYELSTEKYFSAKANFSTSNKAQTELVANENAATVWVINLKSNNPDKYTISPSSNTGTFLNFHGGIADSDNIAGAVGFHTNGKDDQGSFWLFENYKNLPESPIQGKVYTIINDHIGVPYYVSKSRNQNNNAQDITAERAEDGSQEWIFWGDGTNNYKFYNLVDNTVALKSYDGQDTHKVIDERNKVGYTIVQPTNSNKRIGGDTYNASLSGGLFSTGTYNEYVNGNLHWSTDFVFVPVGKHAYKLIVVGKDDASITYNDQTKSNGGYFVFDYGYTPVKNDFDFHAPNGYTASFEVNTQTNTITVTYEEEAPSDEYPANFDELLQSKYVGDKNMDECAEIVNAYLNDKGNATKKAAAYQAWQEAPVRTIDESTYYVIESAYSGFTDGEKRLVELVEDGVIRDGHANVSWKKCQDYDDSNVFRFVKEESNVSWVENGESIQVGNTYNLFSVAALHYAYMDDGFGTIGTSATKSFKYIMKSKTDDHNGHYGFIQIIDNGQPTNQFSIVCRSNEGFSTFSLSNGNISANAETGDLYRSNATGRKTISAPESVRAWRIREVTEPECESIEVTVSSAGVATMYFGHDVVVPEGTTVKGVYLYDEENYEVQNAYLEEFEKNTYILNYHEFKAGDIIPGGNGVLVFGEGKHTFNTSHKPRIYKQANMLFGTTQANIPLIDESNRGNTIEEHIATTWYALSKKNNLVAFYNFIGPTFTPHKAYLSAVTTELSSSYETAKFLIFDPDNGMTTSLETVLDGSQSEEIYDLSGRTVNSPKRGVFIQKGSKVIR